MFLTGEAQVRSGQRAHDAKFNSLLLHFIVKTSRNFEHVIKSESCLIYSHDAYIISFDGLSIDKLFFSQCFKGFAGNVAGSKTAI